MIVKKVGTSKKAAPKSKAANVRALVDYIAGPDAAGDAEKIEHRGALNLLNIDHDAQVDEMIDLAELARRSPQPVQHWIMSWREGEQPTTAQADEAVKMFLEEMGLAKHQAIYALHRDTHNWHLHLAVNRVDPETEKLVTVNQRFDHEIAHRAIACIELRQGWEREAHALYESGADGRIARVQPRAAKERQPSARARDFEERAGERSAERIAIDDAAPIIRRARSWHELHGGLATKGMRFEKKGSGALLWVGEQPVKASAAGRDCSMAALQKRLGEFEPAPIVPPRSPTPPRPLEPSSPLLQTYVQERRKHYEERSAVRTRLVDQQREEWRQLADAHRRQRTEIIRGAWTRERDVLNAMRSLVAAQQAQEKAVLRERQELERAAMRRARGRFPWYEEWLARDSRDRANEWRHRERRPPSIEGPTFERPAPRDIRAFSAVVDGSKVHYCLTGARGTPAFTDRGQTIDIHDSRRRASVLAALQLSAQKWGVISVRGDEQFKRTCVELAAVHGFKLANADLQDAITAERERINQTRRPEIPGRSDDRRSELMTPAAIYDNHRADILKEQPHRRHQAPSRLDAEIAVRMYVTGHSREQIVVAIGSGALAARPNENRNWNTYAQRTADYAFSPPGERMREQLRGRERDLIRLEGREGERELLRRLGGPMRYL